MSENEPKREKVTLEELTISNMYEIQAMLELLEEKGILTREEVLEKIEEMRKKN